MVKWTHFRKLGVTSIRPNFNGWGTTGGDKHPPEHRASKVTSAARGDPWTQSSFCAGCVPHIRTSKQTRHCHIYEIVRNDTVYFLLWKIRNYVTLATKSYLGSFNNPCWLEWGNFVFFHWFLNIFHPLYQNFFRTFKTYTISYRIHLGLYAEKRSDFSSKISKQNKTKSGGLKSL